MTALRTLKVGLRGPDVVRWQRFLKIAADGIFGPKTREATITFQREHATADCGQRFQSCRRDIGLSSGPEQTI